MIRSQTSMGKAYLAYVSDTAVWNPAVHSVEMDLIRSLRFTFAENQAWTATIGIVSRNGALQNNGRRRVLISTDDSDSPTGKRLLFDGFIRSWPSGTPGKDLSFEANTFPLNLLAAKQAATAAYDPDPWGLINGLGRVVNGLNAGPGNYRQPEDRLGASYALIHYSRFGRAPQVVDLIQGDGTILDIADNFVDGTLVMSTPPDPITTIFISCTANWEQAQVRTIDLGSTRPVGSFGLGQEGQGPGEYLFLNSKDWARDWMRPGDSIGGWNVVESGYRRLDTVDYSNEFLAEPQANKGFTAGQTNPFSVTFRRFHEQFDLVVQGVQRAQRQETVQWRLDWVGQAPGGAIAKTDRIDQTLQSLRGPTGFAEWQSGVQVNEGDVVSVEGILYQANEDHVTGDLGATTDDTGSTTRGVSFYAERQLWNPVLIDHSALGGPGWDRFFGQPEQISGENGGTGSTLIITRTPTPGVTALRYLHLQAVARMAQSMRHTLSFDVPFDFVRTLDGREIVSISGDQVVGGQLFGKVTAMTFEMNPERGWTANLTLGMIPGTGVGVSFPGMLPYQPAGFDEPSASIRVDWTNDRAEARLAERQYPAVDPAPSEKIVELGPDGQPKPDNGKPKGYNLGSEVESMNPAIRIDMTPLQGAVQRQIVLTPSGGANGVFTWSGPRNVQLPV